MIPRKITKSYIAICEGTADVDTFRVLVAKKRIRNIEFICPDKDTSGGFGKNYFYGVLDAITGVRGFENLKGILLVQDTDDDPNIALREMKAQVKKANKGFITNEKFTIPNQLLVPYFSANRPPLMFVTIPWIDEKGALETLILPSLESKFPKIQECLNNYYDCSQPLNHINEWNVSKQSKMRLASMVAAICRKDPTCAIQNMWSKDEFKDLMEHECFDKVTQLFRNKSRYFKKK